MTTPRFGTNVLAAFLCLLVTVPVLAAPPQAARPPQYVLLSFDNCQENQTWTQVSDFLSDINHENDSDHQVHFTFYLSAVGLLGTRHKNLYENPSAVLREISSVANSTSSKFKEKARRLGRGRSFSTTGESNIGFGGTDQEISQRVAFLNEMYRNGNEIASHAVGHYDGAGWTEEMWRHEFREYEKIISQTAALAFSTRDIRGFRAPYLSGNRNLYTVMKEFQFDFDSSSADRNFDGPRWPARRNVQGEGDGAWDIGLGFVNAAERNTQGREIGSKKVAAMDYNFCFEQTKGCQNANDPVNAQRDAEDMLRAYYGYFLQAFNGNRAPVVIGHHFFPYRGGVYNRALLKFARVVCAMPEVKCTTFSDLTSFLEKNGSELASYQRGNFPKAATQPTMQDLLNSAPDLM